MAAIHATHTHTHTHAHTHAHTRTHARTHTHTHTHTQRCYNTRKPSRARRVQFVMPSLPPAGILSTNHGLFKKIDWRHKMN